MEVKRIFETNYLARKRYSFGETYSALFVAICVLVTLGIWNSTVFDGHSLASQNIAVFKVHEYWRLVSSLFVHADISHLLSNSLMLFILFYFNASFFGGIFTFVSSIVFGGLTNLITIYLYPESTYLVGASGIVYFLWGHWLLVYLGVQTQFSFLSRLLRVLGIFLILLVPTSLDPQTSYLAHYLGLGIGLFWGLITLLRKIKWMKSFERWRYEYVPDEEDEDLVYLEN